MKSRVLTILFAAVSTVGLFNDHVSAAVLYTQGHGDIGLAIEEGNELFLHYHFDPTSVIDGVALEDTPNAEFEYEPADVLTRLAHAPEARPAGAQWDFIGNAAGADTWYIPQTQIEDRPWLGFGTEELEPGSIVGDVQYAITSFSGPGQFSLSGNSPFGEPIVAMSTFTGDLTHALPAGTHAHLDFFFTAPGTYEIGLTATLTPTGGTPVSDTATFSIEVVPEPATLGTVGAAGVALLRRRRR